MTTRRLSDDVLANGLRRELLLNPFLCWAGQAQKCYDTGPVKGILLFFFFFSLNWNHHTHTHSLKRQSDRTVTLSIRVSSIEHVCHISSSCWVKFGELTPPSLPITGHGTMQIQPNSTMRMGMNFL